MHRIENLRDWGSSRTALETPAVLQGSTNTSLPATHTSGEGKFGVILMFDFLEKKTHFGLKFTAFGDFYFFCVSLVVHCVSTKYLNHT